MNTELLTLCRQRNLTPGDLDDLIHELVTDSFLPRINQEATVAGQRELLFDAAEEAARINNTGLEGQTEYLIEALGLAEAKSRLREIQPT